MAGRASSLAIDQFAGHCVSHIQPTVVVAGVKSPTPDQRRGHVRAVSGLPPSEPGVFGFVIRGRQVLVDHGRQPVAVGYLAVAASGLPDSSDAIVLSLFTNSGSLASVAAGARFKVEEIDLTIGLIPGAEDSPDERRFLARHGRTSVQWDGHPGASRPPESRSIQLTGAMVGNGYFPIAAAFEADSAFVASGNLGVTGQGELYALLASSPIRLLTSYLRGGDADWVLGQ